MEYVSLTLKGTIRFIVSHSQVFNISHPSKSSSHGHRSLIQATFSHEANGTMMITGDVTITSSNDAENVNTGNTDFTFESEGSATGDPDFVYEVVIT